jgi:hypothetical protein
VKYLSQNIFGSTAILELDEVSSPPAINNAIQLEKGNASHAGIARTIQLVVSEKSLTVVHTFAKHSLLSVSRFHSNTTLASGMLANTTGIGCKDLRLRFIIYQLLQVIGYIHAKGLCLESLNPCDIMLDDEMWVYLPMGLSNRLLYCAGIQSKQTEFQRRNQNTLIAGTGIPRPVDYYEPLSIQWISGKISNFEYLMAINSAAGRTMIDPLYHPILPWVTDFTTNCMDILQPLSYRDLSKTKFRLSKGDTQLETTFRHSDPPHHIPESLSELTYYIYLARRTPMQVLRRVVRDVFVPEHYPQSMNRIYEWTPDECIPEFYMDPSVFKSIHYNHGLTDLEVPDFLQHSPEGFIKYHRSILESAYVSENLHLWIDLTFGYCLEGQPAIDHMNVPLHHTLSSTERQGLDSPNVNKNPGFVMLFDSPHPVRQIRNPTMSSAVYAYENLETLNDKDFVELNALYSEESNQKYMIKPMYLGHRYDLEGLDDFVSLDKESPMTKAFRTANLGNPTGTQGNNPNSNRNEAVSSQQGGGGGMNMGDNAPRRSRKSLIRPHQSEITWHKFKYLDDCSLKTDNRGDQAVKNLLLQTDHFKFADRTTAFIDGSYSMPKLPGKEAENISSSDKKTTDYVGSSPYEEKSKKIISSITDVPFTTSLSKENHELWDFEFISAMLLSEEVMKMDGNYKENYLSFKTQMLRAAENPENGEENHVENPQEARSVDIEDENKIQELQSDDMFAIGCMIAELYNGRSLISKNDSLAMSKGILSFKDCLTKIYKRTLGMPLILQRLISILTHPVRKCRPQAQEIIESCIIQNVENSAFPPEDYLLKESHLTSSGNELKSKENLERFSRISLLQEYCHSLFPDYFQSVYSVISSLKLASDGLIRLHTLLNSVEEIALLPIDGLNLGLVHFLDVIAESDFFTDHLQEAYDIETIDVKSIVVNYWRIIDVLSLRLGLEGTERLIIPHVVKFLNSFTATQLLKDLLVSPLFNILALRCGVKSFLRNFLSFLLTYLSAGTLHHVLLRKSYYETPGWTNENLPLWTNVTAKINEKDEWLKKSPIVSIHRVQRAAVTALSNLSEVDSLGSGICARYILPSLLSLVGVPHLASTGFEPRRLNEEATNPNNMGFNNGIANPVTPPNPAIHELSEKIFDELVQQSVSVARKTLQDIDRPPLYELSRNPLLGEGDSENEGEEGNQQNSETSVVSHSVSIPEKVSQTWISDRGLLESYIMKRATFNAEHMYCVKVIVEMGTKSGDVVISELILSTIVNIILPELESNLTTIPKQGTAAALMEIILLLNGLLPILSPEIIHHDLLQPSRLSNCCIPRLLSIWPLVPAFSFLDDNLSEELTGQFNILYCIENVRLHSVLLELCRLIVSMSMIVGADLTSEFVLPHLDMFFKNFVNTFGIFPVETRTMLKAFELGAEIYLPLVQIVSAEAFYTAVPNLNPRLELWLRAIGSNIPPKSPPLPPNIWPEATSEVAARPEKKKSWFPQWFRGQSNNSNNNNNANSNTATPAMVITSASQVIPGNKESSFPPPPPSNLTPAPSSSVKQSNFPIVSLLKGKSSVPPPDEFELRESQVLGGELESTPHRPPKKGPYRTPSVAGGNQQFVSPPGTELVDLGTTNSSNNNATVVRRISNEVDETSKANETSSNPAPLPAITVSILSMDENQARAISPMNRRRKRSGGGSMDDTVRTNSTQNTEEDHGNDGSVSGDSDDEIEPPQNDSSVVIVDHEEHEPEPEPEQPEEQENHLTSVAYLADSPEASRRKVVSFEPAVQEENPEKTTTTEVEPEQEQVEPPLPFSIDPLTNKPIVPALNMSSRGGSGGLAQMSLATPAPSTQTSNGQQPLKAQLSPTPRVLFSPETSSKSTGSTANTGLKMSLDDGKNPFRRYQKLLTNRLINKSNRYNSFTQSPMKIRSMSVVPNTNRRTSLAKSMSSSASHANHPVTNLSSNSNYLIMNSMPGENETTEEMEYRESRYSELTWLLAGYGRWNVDKEMKDRLTKEQTKIMKGYKSTISYYNSNNEWNPAAQMSMTAPKIAVDVVNDSSSLINFQLQANTQWKLEDPPGLIKCMVTNANETLLMTCSRSGVRLFSLSTHPILHVSSYTNHSMPPFAAAFLRDGLHAMTCDGSIHLWDIESRQALGIIIPVDKTTGYSSASVIPSKFGIHAMIDSVGDEQILSTLSDTVSYFDLRCNYSKPMNRIAEWILPQIPPPQGNFISSTVEPLQLTCAYSSDNYVFAGSLTGGLYIIERRMGKLLNSWQAHDGPILKVNALSERHILAVSERSAAVWEYLPEVSPTTYPISSLYPGTFSQFAYNHSIHNTPIAYHEFRDYNSSNPTGMMSGSSGNPGYSQSNIAVSMYHMGYGGIGEVKKVLNMKNLHTDSVYSMNNVVVSNFENNFYSTGFTGLTSTMNREGGGSGGGGGGGSGHHHGGGSGMGGSGGGSSLGNGGTGITSPAYLQQLSKYSGTYESMSGGTSSNNFPSSNSSSLSNTAKMQKVLYCLSGHRMHSAFLPEYSTGSSTMGSAMNSPNPMSNKRMTPKDVSFFLFDFPFVCSFVTRFFFSFFQ